MLRLNRMETVSDANLPRIQSVKLLMRMRILSKVAGAKAVVNSGRSWATPDPMPEPTAGRPIVRRAGKINQPFGAATKRSRHGSKAKLNSLAAAMS